MLDQLKSVFSERAGQLLGSRAALGILSSPQFHEALRKAINLRSDVRESWEKQAENVARALNLVTRTDIKTLKKSLREVENQVAALEWELRQQKAKVLEARTAADEAKTAAASAKAMAAPAPSPPIPTAAAAAPAAPNEAPPAKKAAPRKASAGRAAPKKAAAGRAAAPKKASAGRAAPKKG